MEHVVRVSGLTQCIADEIVLDNVNFQVDAGKLFILFGYSGSGKTTLISILAGVQAYKSGTVEVCDRRDIGLVTQQYSLFTHLTVQENLQAIGMMKGMSPQELNHRVPSVVEALQLENALRHRAGRLPWGAQQRLALACAILNNPRLLLVDDILSRGDPESTEVIVRSTRAHVAQGNTCIWATGRLPEVFDLAASDHVEIGLLVKGNLTVHQPQEFAALMQDRTPQHLKRNGDTV